MTANDAFSLTSNCAVPWKSLDSYSRRPRTRSQSGDYPTDDKEMIIQCFNCTKSECDNCHHYNYKSKRKARMKEAKDIFLGYYYAGYGRAYICEVMRISQTTYYRFLNKFIKGKG